MPTRKDSLLTCGSSRPRVPKVTSLSISVIAKCAIPIALLIASVTWGQETPRPNAIATQLTTQPTLDGDVKDDPAWRSVTPITDFTQWQPTNGAPATRKTEVYFAFSDEFVHVGVICHEPSQDDIILSSDGFQSDSFTMAIDTFLNGQTGFMFGTNPIGVEYDASLDHEYADWNWSTTWKVRSKYIDEGWSAEFEIPFTSLRYGSEEVQTWGVNFARNQPKNQRTVSLGATTHTVHHVPSVIGWSNKRHQGPGLPPKPDDHAVRARWRC